MLRDVFNKRRFVENWRCKLLIVSGNFFFLFFLIVNELESKIKLNRPAVPQILLYAALKRNLLDKTKRSISIFWKKKKITATPIHQNPNGTINIYLSRIHYISDFLILFRSFDFVPEFITKKKKKMRVCLFRFNFYYL